MNLTKKSISILLAVFLLTGCLAAAGISASAADDAAAEKNIQIVTTIFPIYDWVQNILGKDAEHADLTMLLDNGVDLHSYQLTADDIIRISTCDLFIYVGGESDEWVHDALQEAMNQDMIVINLLEELGDAVKEEELVEGMEAGHEHDHDEEADHEDGDEHDEDHEHDHEEVEYDEHVWLSLKNAAVLCRTIADALAEVDSVHAADYADAADAYIEKLNSLDGQYQAAADAAQFRTVLFGDRFPFRYLTDDYGLSYYAAFSGCSAETEASFEAIIFLTQKLEKLGLPAILQIESSDGSIARTIAENTKSGDPEILTLDSMQSTTSKDAAAGTSYLSIMEENLGVLKAALG